VSTDFLEFFAPCPRGTEKLLAEELRSLRCRSVRPQRAGVSFAGPIEVAYRACLWSRVASRVLLTLARVPAVDDVELYDGVRALPWEDHVRADGTIAVDATGVSDTLRNTQFTAVRVKDAIADRFVDLVGYRPSVNTATPDVLINVVIRDERAIISIDLAGPPLHRRGYREQGVQVEAPMKENLAAAVLAIAGWKDIAKRGGAFIDPLCGSGTLAIEAALWAADMAPGMTRRRWGFDNWLGHDAELWADIREEAADRGLAGLATIPPIQAFDADPRAISIARAAVRRAGLEGHVVVEQRELAQLVAPPTREGATEGLIAMNPPYGERIQAQNGLPYLYGQLAQVTRTGFAGWTLAVITPDDSLSSGLGLRPERTADLFNGKILSPVRVYRVPDPKAVATPAPAVARTEREPHADTPHAAAPVATTPAVAAQHSAPASSYAESPSPAPKPKRQAAPAASAPVPVATTDDEPVAPIVLDPAAEVFANRLYKMGRHYERWARKAHIGCYRVYDADLPDYAVAIDVYNGAGDDIGKHWVHVAEYAPPAEIDTRRASQRLEDVLAIAPEVLGVESRDVFLKVRERQRGNAQYARVARTGAVGTVSEGELLFEVNLSDYLDTGIFLDHRLTRAMLRDMATGTRFLNLFAYTGTATVHAAAGGAASTTTVDMSATYTEWAGRNLAMNGFAGPQHEVVQADALAWLDLAKGRGDVYDLVFCDPPTFSNSKRMHETLDVQRDHAAIIGRIAHILAEDGTLVFSCNRKKFVLDTEALTAAGLSCEDITARTVARDFERHPNAHGCWLIRHAGAR